MISAAEEAKPWSRRRWGMTIALVLAVQALLVFVLENRTHATPRKRAPLPMIRMRDNLDLALLPVNDPTLFALPHREGFSGEAWLNEIYPMTNQPADYTEPPRWLTLTTETLGASFKQFIVANASPPFESIVTAPAPLLAPKLFPEKLAATESTLQIGGELAGRQLIAPFPLPAWTNSDFLAKSVVQVLVNARGEIFSTALLQGCGLPSADAKALELARQARFRPDESDTANHSARAFALGTLEFEWQTLPPPSTNAPPGTL